MLQGTGSGVGKSLLTAAFCRLAHRRGIAVAPFKGQNMSNNAAVTADGGEIHLARNTRSLGLFDGTATWRGEVDRELDHLADVVERCLDVDAVVAGVSAGTLLAPRPAIPPEM